MFAVCPIHRLSTLLFYYRLKYLLDSFQKKNLLLFACVWFLLVHSINVAGYLVACNFFFLIIKPNKYLKKKQKFINKCDYNHMFDVSNEYFCS